MSARFTTNFLILLLGAGLVIATFAFSHAMVGWVALGVESAGVLVAAHNFALPHQGAYQRSAERAMQEAAHVEALTRALHATRGER